MLQHFYATLVGLVLVGVAACGGGGGGDNAPAPEPVTTEQPPPVALVEAFPNLTFDSPVALVQHPTDAQRWYVVERSGRIRTFAGAEAASSTLFLDIASRVASDGEGGLLGMALHPDFGTHGEFYVNYTAPGNPLTTRIARFTSTDGGLTAPAAGEVIVLNVDQPFENHNGGWLEFGPDGYLYVALGDGGSGGDPQGNAQNRNNLLGSILRIDVSRPQGEQLYAIPADNPFAASAGCGMGGGCPEIFAWGFRNPWRGSFDRVGGALWIGDVGQDAWEEIDRVLPGRNYGWNLLEGNHCYEAASCNSAGLTPPVAEYGHGNGDDSITGGYVYRGSALSGLDGDYIYGDFISGRIFRLVDAAGGGTRAELLLEPNVMIVSFAQDHAGELYVLDFGSGTIYRLAPADG